MQSTRALRTETPTSGELASHDDLMAEKGFYYSLSAAPLLIALHDALGLDDRLRPIWREQLVQPRIDAVAAAIRRDQAAGAISATIDADATALALSLMSEQLLLELICRNGADPEEYARVAAPIWESALFGRPNDPGHR